MNGLFTHTLANGADVSVVYIFIDEDETVGLSAEFEINVYQDGLEITNDLSQKDTAKIETEVAHRFKQQVEECRRQNDIDRWESQLD
jgi:predicted secreted protein